MRKIGLLLLVALGCAAAELKVRNIAVVPPEPAFQMTRSFIALRIQEAPIIDGEETDRAWQNCEPATDFFLTGKPIKSGNATTVKCCFDEKNLYLLFICGQPSTPFSEVSEDNGPGRIWLDDSVEFFFDPDGEANCFYHILLNSNGKRLDLYHKIVKTSAKTNVLQDATYRSEAIVASSKNPDGWKLEVSVPLDRLGIKQIRDGDTFRVNFTRYVRGENENSNWAGLPVGTNLAPEFFGRLHVGSGEVVLESFIWGQPGVGINRLTGVIRASANESLNASVGDKQYVLNLLQGSNPFSLDYRLAPDDQEVVFRLLREKQILLERRTSLDLSPELLQAKLNDRVYQPGEVLLLQLKTAFGKVSMENARLNFILRNQAGQPLAQTEQPAYLESSARIIPPRLAPGNYALMVELQAENRSWATKTLKFSIEPGAFD